MIIWNHYIGEARVLSSRVLAVGLRPRRSDLLLRSRLNDSRNDFLKDFLRDIVLSPIPVKSVDIHWIQKKICECYHFL